MLEAQGVIGRSETALTLGISGAVIADVDGNTVLVTTTGAPGGLNTYLLREGQTARLSDSLYFTSGQARVASSELSVLDTQNGTVLGYGAGGGAVFGYTVSGQGMLQSTVQTQNAGTADMSLAGMSQTTSGRAYVAGDSGSALYGLQQTAGGQWQQTMMRNMRADGVREAVALETVHMGNAEYLLVLCRGGDAVTSYAANPNGTLGHANTLGAAHGLGILDAPTGLEVVQAHGQTYALIASASGTGQAGAISVMRIAADGSLEPTDHVLDTLNTRFAGTHSLAVINAGDQVFVLAAGADDGISLFSLMPGGRLVYQESLSANEDLSLSSISGVTAHRVGSEIQIFTTSHLIAGLTQLKVSLEGRTETFVAPVNGGRVTGREGHDVLSGSRGADTLSGGVGDDILWDGEGVDRLTGGGGADLFVLAWDGETDRITDFNPSQDHLDLSHYRMFYDPSQLAITSTNSGARVEWRGEMLEIISHNGASLSRTQILSAVAAGPDRPLLIVNTEVAGTMHADQLAGGWGSDNMMGYEGDDLINGGGGGDTLTGYVGDDTLNGGSGDDVLLGGGQADRLFGDAGNDTVWGGYGTDFAVLGAGNDVFEDSDQGGRYSRDTVFGGAGADTIRGGGGNDRFFGERDSDLIRGGAGGDTLSGGTGTDQLFGNAGADRLFGGPGADTLFGHDGVDTLRGGTGQDRLTGGDGIDLLFGERDNDFLFGDAGADTLDGGGGADSLDGGDGADRLMGGHGADTVRGGNGTDTVFLGTGRDRFVDNAEGGSAGSDTVYGGTGADTILGGGGDDVFRGEIGNDSLTGGAGADRLEGAGGADTLVGGTQNDVLLGGSGQDAMFGGGGADTLRGGTGRDQLTGGSGRDVFVFTRMDGKDRILDFNVDVDVLRLDNALWGGTLTATQVVSRFGQVRNGDVVLDFGAEEILLVDISSLAGLAQDIDLF